MWNFWRYPKRYKSDDYSTMPPLISEEEIDVMSSGDNSDDGPMYTEMLEDICDGSKSHLSVNMREVCYKIRDCIKQSQAKYKGALLSTWNMGKGLHKLFKSIIHDISLVLPIFGESGS